MSRRRRFSTSPKLSASIMAERPGRGVQRTSAARQAATGGERPSRGAGVQRLRPARSRGRGVATMHALDRRNPWEASVCRCDDVRRDTHLGAGVDVTFASQRNGSTSARPHRGRAARSRNHRASGDLQSRCRSEPLAPGLCSRVADARPVRERIDDELMTLDRIVAADLADQYPGGCAGFRREAAAHNNFQAHWLRIDLQAEAHLRGNYGCFRAASNGPEAAAAVGSWRYAGPRAPPAPRVR